MKLILTTTDHNLTYQRDNESPCTMYGSAAGIGIQFDDELETTVRAHSTAYLGVNCISVGQRGTHRHFYVPVGKSITLDGRSVTPLKYQYAFPLKASRLYQHHFTFKTTKQAKRALRALSQTNVIAMYVQRSGRCRLLSFQTPYQLGPIMRGVLYNKMQPASAFFNRQPRTYEPYPFFQRVTQGQVILTAIVFLLFCAVEFLRLPKFDTLLSVLEFGYQIAARLSFTIAVAWISPDVLGLVKNCGAFSQFRAVVRQLKDVKVPMFQDAEGHTTESLSVADLVGITWQLVGPVLIVYLAVSFLLLALPHH